jgi:hypothetical protein
LSWCWALTGCPNDDANGQDASGGTDGSATTSHAGGGNSGGSDEAGSNAGGSDETAAGTGGKSSAGTGGKSSAGTGGKSSAGTGGKSSAGTGGKSSAGGQPSSFENVTQASMVFVPETCTVDNRSWTIVATYISETTNYCKWIADQEQITSCPPATEQVLQIIIGRVSYTSVVDAIGPGTYPWPVASATLYKGDGSASCPYSTATDGTVTLTKVDSQNIVGTYQFTIDGKDVSGTLNSTVCWSGADTRGPCAQ